MAKAKKPKKKTPQNNRFSSREKIVLYYKGEEKEFKNTTDFCKETKISGAVVKDWYEGSLTESFKGWDINRLRSMDQELDQ